MFDDNIRVEPIPERVYELCKLVSKKSGQESDFRNMIEPESLNSTGTKYFGFVRDAAIELKLIKKIDSNLEYIADKSILKNMNTFRTYCNSIIWKSINKKTYFYKVSKCFLTSNSEWLKYRTLTDMNILKYVRETENITNVDPVFLLGTRFWLSFLGFGFIQETGNKMNFLPNMYIALKDFISFSDFEKGKEYSVSEFFANVSKEASVIADCYNNHTVNLALSNALRQLHDNKEIIIKRHLDSEEVWNLQKNSSHEIVSEITHIIYKGAKI